MQKLSYEILLGGSTISGKTSFVNTYSQKYFYESMLTTIGVENYDFKFSKCGDKKFILFDTSRWAGRFKGIIKRYIYIADGVILLFDLSKKEDFEQLPDCLSMITDYYELEEFPVLLVGNKADLEKEVEDEEIQQFAEKNKFIRYFQVSSKTYTNVEESINFMFEYIYEKDKIFPIPNIIKKTKRKK